MAQDLLNCTPKIFPANLPFSGEEEVEGHCQSMGGLPQQSKFLKVLPADLHGETVKTFRQQQNHHPAVGVRYVSVMPTRKHLHGKTRLMGIP